MAPSVARSLQLHSDRFDDVLTRRAREQTPGILHWWGRRWREGRNGAWCYLCERFITTWAASWPISETCRREIAAHRAEHRMEYLERHPAGQKEST